jgi:hypothetical protein
MDEEHSIFSFAAILTTLPIAIGFAVVGRLQLSQFLTLYSISRLKRSRRRAEDSAVARQGEAEKEIFNLELELHHAHLLREHGAAGSHAQTLARALRLIDACLVGCANTVLERFPACTWCRIRTRD